MRTAARHLWLTTRCVLTVCLGVVVGKMLQYASLAAFESTLGFNLASLLAAGPFVSILLLANRRWPSLSRYDPGRPAGR